MHHATSHMVRYIPDIVSRELPPSPEHCTQTPIPTCDIWWRSLETCSNLFIWGPTPYPKTNVQSWQQKMKQLGFQAAGMHPTGMLSCLRNGFCGVFRSVCLVLRISPMISLGASFTIRWQNIMIFFIKPAIPLSTLMALHTSGGVNSLLVQRIIVKQHELRLRTWNVYQFLFLYLTIFDLSFLFNPIS